MVEVRQVGEHTLRHSSRNETQKRQVIGGLTGRTYYERVKISPGRTSRSSIGKR